MNPMTQSAYASFLYANRNISISAAGSGLCWEFVLRDLVLCLHFLPPSSLHLIFEENYKNACARPVFLRFGCMKGIVNIYVTVEWGINLRRR
jgi:hypothetical protein